MQSMLSADSANMFIAVLFMFIINAVNSEERPAKVVTPVGEFIGTVTDVSFGGETKAVRKFLGIPFAKPPLGELRFAPSIKADIIKFSYNATYYRPHCPQREDVNSILKHFKVDEDCLHLNIFIPGSFASVNKKYDVMVWIYGGGFSYGGADIYSGDVLSAFNDVIVVTFNYRMNVFGFLKTSDASAPGNAGLWDQHLAIKWVHDNIAPFGGDRNKVTLFGESAGGASAIYQGLFEINRGLFNRLIAQSGSPLAPWAYQAKPEMNFEAFANRTNCTLGGTSSKLKCLRSKSASELLSKLKMLDTYFPTVDGTLIKEPPDMLFSNTSRHSNAALQTFAKLDFLSGVNDKEGALIIANFWGKLMKKIFINVGNGVPKFYFDMFYLPATIKTLKYAKTTALQESVNHQYTDWSEPSDKLKVRKNAIDLASDVYFIVPAIQAANNHSEIKRSKSTYFYEFIHRTSLSDQPDWITGASHTMEIPFVWGFPNSFKIIAGLPPDARVDIPEQEVQLSRQMMTMWTNFAKTG